MKNVKIEVIPPGVEFCKKCGYITCICAAYPPKAYAPPTSEQIAALRLIYDEITS